MSKDKDYKTLINKKYWRELRKQKLSQDPLCETCKAKGYITAATEVHHITPVEDGISIKDKERLMYNYTNLRSLCHACHVQAHIELGRSSREGNERRTHAQLNAFAERFFSDREESKDGGSVFEKGVNEQETPTPLFSACGIFFAIASLLFWSL